jgi:hypothetical protein
MAGSGFSVDPQKIQAVVDRVDRLTDRLRDASANGGYAALQKAADIATPLSSVAEQEIATLVLDYNGGFGAAAAQYQALANMIVSIRNSTAQTSNVHSDNDGQQSKSFDPLKGGDSLSVTPGTFFHGPSVTEKDPDGNVIPTDTPGTTTLAPGDAPGTPAANPTTTEA